MGKNEGNVAFARKFFYDKKLFRQAGYATETNLVAYYFPFFIIAARSFKDQLIAVHMCVTYIQKKRRKHFVCLCAKMSCERKNYAPFV